MIKSGKDRMCRYKMEQGKGRERLWHWEWFQDVAEMLRFLAIDKRVGL